MNIKFGFLKILLLHICEKEDVWLSNLIPRPDLLCMNGPKITFFCTSLNLCGKWKYHRILRLGNYVTFIYCTWLLGLLEVHQALPCQHRRWKLSRCCNFSRRLVFWVIKLSRKKNQSFFPICNSSKNPF